MVTRALAGLAACLGMAGSLVAQQPAAKFGTPREPAVVEHNWLNGGNYTVNSGLPGSHILYRHNRFGREYNYGLRRTHDKRQRWTSRNWMGNVWDDTGEPTHPAGERAR